MKKKLFILAVLAVGFGLTACSVDVDTSGLDELEEQLEEASDKMNEEEDNTEDEIEAVPGATYQCPDDCENGPSYDVPGPCVKCGKEMVIL